MCGAARRKHERRKVWAASGARRREKPGSCGVASEAGRAGAAVLRSQREAAKAESAEHVHASRTCTQARPREMGTPSRNLAADWLPGPVAHVAQRGADSAALPWCGQPPMLQD